MPLEEPHIDKLKYLFYNARVGIAICNAEDNTLEMVNPAFAAIHGYEPHELIETSPNTVFSPESLQRLNAYKTALSCGIDDQTFETTHIQKDGSLVPVSVHITMIKDERGAVKQQMLNIEDISKRKQAESELVLRESEFHSLAENMPVNIARWDREGRYSYINPVHARTLGKTASEIIGTLIPDSHAHVQAAIIQVVATGESIAIVETVLAKNGSIKYHEVSLVSERDASGQIVSVLGIGHDITEHKRMEEMVTQKESRLKEAQKIAKIGSWELEFPALELSWSDEIYRIFEIDPSVFQPSYEHFLNAVHPDDRALIDAAYADALKNKTPYEIVHRLLLKNGLLKYVHERGETFYNEEGDPIRSVGTVQDISKQKVTEKKIEHMAHHDALTGLPNRTFAKASAEQIIANAKRSEAKAAFLFIDLDGFKAINDTLGHSAGDLMLKTIASRLKKCVRESAIISRQGGDEFLLILSDIKEENLIASAAQKVLAELQKSFEINAHTFSTSASIGISLYPDHGETFELLLRSADTAMYKAKESGKNTYCFYSEKMKHDLIGQFKLQNDLKSALHNSEFVLFYQPQIDLGTNRITGAEALIRWNHPQMGMVPPMNFIPLAESSGLIVQIGQWVIEEACRQAAAWQRSGIEITVAVNISAVQFKRGNLETVVTDALAASGLNPSCLELELTESVMMHDMESTLLTVRNLKSLGVQLSIDDFGTGYSSLAYLKRFAVDKLKIDQSFVQNILENKEDAVIVKTIIQMAKNLNLKTIAEGVEDAEVLAAVETCGCDEVQGYHFAKPMEASEFEKYHADFVK